MANVYAHYFSFDDNVRENGQMHKSVRACLNSATEDAFLEKQMILCTKYHSTLHIHQNSFSYKTIHLVQYLSALNCGQKCFSSVRSMNCQEQIRAFQLDPSTSLAKAKEYVWFH